MALQAIKHTSFPQGFKNGPQLLWPQCQGFQSRCDCLTTTIAAASFRNIKICDETTTTIVTAI